MSLRIYLIIWKSPQTRNQKQFFKVRTGNINVKLIYNTIKQDPQESIHISSSLSSELHPARMRMESGIHLSLHENCNHQIVFTRLNLKVYYRSLIPASKYVLKVNSKSTTKRDLFLVFCLF